MAVLLTACTPALVPVRVAPIEVPVTRTDAQVRLVGLERAQLTRGAVGDDAIGTKWQIDARDALTEAATTAFPSTDGPTLTLILRDFDVDWTTRQSGGVAEVTLRSLVQLEFAADDRLDRRSGTVIGRGRVVETGWGPKVDQRLGRAIQHVIQEAIRAAFVDLSAEPQ